MRLSIQVAIAIAIALLSTPALAQQKAKTPPWEKTDTQRREDAEIEKAYKSAISSVPEQRGNTDPWAGARETPAKTKPEKKPAAR